MLRLRNQKNETKSPQKQRMRRERRKKVNK